MKTIEPAAITSVGHWYTDEKEEVYFSAEITLPRVGRITVRFTTSRYVAKFYEENSNVGVPGWTKWRTIRDSHDALPGIGEKGVRAIYETIEPLANAWVTSEAYAPSKREAIGQFVKRQVQDTRYGFTHTKSLLAKYEDEMNTQDVGRIRFAIVYLEQGADLLAQVGKE